MALDADPAARPVVYQSFGTRRCRKKSRRAGLRWREGDQRWSYRQWYGGAWWRERTHQSLRKLNRQRGQLQMRRIEDSPPAEARHPREVDGRAEGQGERSGRSGAG